MHHPAETPVRIFLAKLSLPVRKLMVRTAVECANQVARTLSFDSKETFAVKLAVDEAFSNAVDHFSGSPDDEQVHLEFYVEGDSLVVSIREKGIPFDQSRAERFTPGDLESANKPGLGSLLMLNAMDSVELFVHGRQGKEVRLTKKLRYGAIPADLLGTRPVRRREKRPTVADPEIRLARVEDLSEVCRLAWRCYGFTQEELLYDLEALTRKVESGEFKSVIAVDPESGALIGHEGFKYHDPSVKVPELGLAFVDPAYRSPGLPLKMARFLYDRAIAEGDRGIFDCSVTTHTFSQKAMQEMGSRPCCLMLGIAASGMQARELATSKQEKGSVMNHYFAIDRSPKTIFIPERHRAMAEDIYRWMEVPREFGHSETRAPEGESSVSVFPLPDELNVAFIVVHAIGKDSEREVSEGLQQCRAERKDAVYLFLPADVPASPFLVDRCEKMGFFLAGVMPHVHGGQDRVLLQFVDIPIDFDAIRIYGDMSRQLKSYVMSEQERVRSLR
jgi:anti-sigma regulatory factor (Ser/Thr protein kinase)/GNAT superfamily N-acetyltransferase